MDLHQLKFKMNEHKKSIFQYCGFFTLVCIIYHLFSDGDFSFLLTLGALISMCSFLMIILEIQRTKSVKGVSKKMMECYVILLLARLLAIIPFEGYLPYDKSGDFIYQAIEATSFLLAGSIVMLCRYKYNNTYDPNSDSLQHIYLGIIALIFALIFHPTLNSFLPSDICWAFALYLEACASLPQLFMFQKEGEVVPWTAHFLFSQVLSKLVSFIFWISSFTELSDPTHTFKQYVGYFVLIAQALQILFMGDFIYQYLKCIKKGVPVTMLLNENV